MKKQCLLVVCFLLLGSIGIYSQTQPTGDPNQEQIKKQDPKKAVMLDYDTGIMSPVGVLELKPGEEFLVKIALDSDRKNFSISIVGEAKRADQDSREASLVKGDLVEVSVFHNSLYEYYQVTVTRNSDHISKTWTIPVITLKWSISFSGGASFSPNLLGLGFNNPVYYLEPGVRKEMNEKGEVTKTDNGFFIKRDTEKEDDLNANLVTMIHVIHPKWCWVPVSLGIGINSDANTRFYLGTGLRLGEEFYLIGGFACAPIKRLPDNLKDDDFSMDGNALANLPTKNKFGIFLSVSYSFAGGTAKERFLQPFATVSQMPAASEKPSPPAALPEIDAGKSTFDGASLIIVGENFGTDKTKIQIVFFKNNEASKPEQTILGSQVKTFETNRIEIDLSKSELKDREELIFKLIIDKELESAIATVKNKKS